jgi:hypothetical protein
MKRLEKRERENLVRIFYTIIKNNDYSFTFVSGNFQINIQQSAIPETPLLTYNIAVIRTDETYFEFVISFSISMGYEKYEVRNFKSLGGCKVIREVIRAMK